ncbi:DNA-3-methyladenine glycosylase family protein [Candidatus Nitrosocosmicus franklandus]|uniref:DNA-(apurinic or apyrimidinic site) lyase n=1 Tax=Candidatus Nitrosocosmicus franklandianus TaxID=1798806 RepID=A0A484IC38_9ARCH|nr:DNA glycosylase [Candidatus Nitrosocosmicus franklandus]VFJ13777.1 DNA-3-methyladenine glycosylase [Candidatus Nitrosocosmicus franklandus]
MNSSRNIINVHSTINSGQYFLWEKRNNSWYGIYDDSILKITLHKHRNNLVYEHDSFPRIEDWPQHVFRLDDKYDEIINEISKKDRIIEKITKEHFGLRIMRQKPIQCIISFLCSSNNNIPRIRLILRNLSRKFGKRIEWDGNTFYSFPTLRTLSTISQSELLHCGFGYRAEYVRKTVISIINQEIDLKFIKDTDYTKSKQEILKLAGVGEKIADCILLFAFDKLEAFPMDTWIIKHFQKKLDYMKTSGLDFKINDKITPKQYRLISKKIREHYGKYSGYAQQFLYYNIREENSRRW